NSSSDAYDAISDLTVKAPFSGTVANVYVSAGDDVSSGAKIADIVDNKTLKATIPFNTSDAGNISVGESASVTLVSSGSILSGRVTAVSSGSETINGSMKVSYVTVEVENPGAVPAGESVTALIGGYACNDVGEIEASSTKTVTAKVSGTVVRVPVVKGDNVSAGATLATITSENVDNQVRNADISLQEAYLQRERLYDQLEDYTIKSPISGTVVRKNKKAGEKIEGNSAASGDTNVLAVIYDMSSLCFQLDVDELDIKKMAVGQRVIVTADAVEGRAYEGIVENVSVNGTIGTNGVTTYPVKVRITDFDDNLLPGMNIEAVITVNEAKDAIAVPTAAVNRGNTVYVKGEKQDEKDMAPEGFKTVRVEIGISNDSFVQIKSGISEGDIVYVTPSADSGQQMMFPGMMGGMQGGMPGGMQGGMPSGNRSGGMPAGGGMR
ncbi:MAG: HlyD family efflux transporter periplasmic adaptor subunit, partial [Clostridia bacterium]|nr:HlyD family efflux transporter periplasmic adaptor subunit [Clostridia bacterium]